MKAVRKAIPRSIQSELLLANRHACCVCQKHPVQIHHIDSDSANNQISNLATLCLPHHDQASMQIGLTKKLQPDQVRHYKETWEAKCKKDIQALSRDRVAFYAALYKNPPRIWELFIKLPVNVRVMAITELHSLLENEEAAKSADDGFSFQAVPKADGATQSCLDSAFKAEIWPSWLPRNKSHPEDQNYPDPNDMGPPHGMAAFHYYDLYCQILVQILAVANPPIPLEYLTNLEDIEDINAFSGRLVIFRDRSCGKDIQSPRSKGKAIGRVQFIHKKAQCRTEMQIRNMYVFSDTAAENLKNCRVCGVGMLGGVTFDEDKQESKITLIPLLIGMGGLGRSDSQGWDWSNH